MRCWDALLCEGTKILFRIALALMKAHEEQLLGQDNAGYVLRQMRLAAASTHDRDALMKVPSTLAFSRNRQHRRCQADALPGTGRWQQGKAC